MIQLTRLNHVPLVLNSDLIEHMEVTPDTVVTLTTGQKIVVLESAEEVVERIIRFRKSILAGASECPLRKQDVDQAFGKARVPDDIDG
jgi:flagellar protein FlbD